MAAWLIRTSGALMRAAVYARVSTDDKGQTVDNQLFAIRGYCQQRGIEIVKEYTDYASAKDLKERKQWRELLKKAQGHRPGFEAILVWKLDRAFRSQHEFHLALTNWEYTNITFHCIADGFELDYRSPIGRAIAGIMAAMAEMESGLISERVKASYARVKSKGGAWGRKPVPVDTAIVQALLSNGYSYRQISDELGIPKSTLNRAVKASQKQPAEIGDNSRLESSKI